METLIIKQTKKYTTEYIIFEYECPVCGMPDEIHIEAQEAFIKKEAKCYRCRYEYRIESE